MLFQTLFLLSLGSLEVCLSAAFTGGSHFHGHPRQRLHLHRRTAKNSTTIDNNENSGAVIQNNLNEQNQRSISLARNALQPASGKTGQEVGTDGIKPGQAPSATDNANFINFCSGQTLTNGKQITAGSCNGIPMGKIPSTSNMISTIITNPQPGTKIPPDTTFTISLLISNFVAGSFVNPTTNYYSAPQDLDPSTGNIIGHAHVTIQDIGSLKSPGSPPDPSRFAFFKGIDDEGDGDGGLSVTVTDGLPRGVYRICTIVSAANHQPVVMPVAQRGAQDDCVRFEVVGEKVGGRGDGNRDGRSRGGGGGGGGKNAGNANEGTMDSGKVDGKAKDQ